MIAFVVIGCWIDCYARARRLRNAVVDFNDNQDESENVDVSPLTSHSSQSTHTDAAMQERNVGLNDAIPSVNV